MANLTLVGRSEDICDQPFCEGLAAMWECEGVSWYVSDKCHSHAQEQFEDHLLTQEEQDSDNGQVSQEDGEEDSEDEGDQDEDGRDEDDDILSTFPNPFKEEEL